MSEAHMQMRKRHMHMDAVCLLFNSVGEDYRRASVLDGQDAHADEYETHADVQETHADAQETHADG